MRSSSRLRRFCAIAILMVFSLLAAGAASAAPQAVKDSPEAMARLQQFAKHQAMLAKSPFKGLKWTGVGPMRPSGRMTDVEAHPSQPGTIYAAAAQGGVWKSTDDGVTWTGIFEHYPTASIGDLAIAPSDPKIVWVGTGEANIFRSSMAGIGIFKSVDAGQHFIYRAWRIRSTSRAFSFTRPIPTSSTRPPPATSTRSAPIAASTRRPTAARRGRRCSTRTSAPA